MPQGSVRSLRVPDFFEGSPMLNTLQELSLAVPRTRTNLGKIFPFETGTQVVKQPKWLLGIHGHCPHGDIQEQWQSPVVFPYTTMNNIVPWEKESNTAQHARTTTSGAKLDPTSRTAVLPGLHFSWIRTLHEGRFTVFPSGGEPGLLLPDSPPLLKTVASYPAWALIRTVLALWGHMHSCDTSDVPWEFGSGLSMLAALAVVIGPLVWLSWIAEQPTPSLVSCVLGKPMPSGSPWPLLEMRCWIRLAELAEQFVESKEFCCSTERNP